MIDDINSFIETSKNDIYLAKMNNIVFNKRNKFLFNDCKIPFLQKTVFFSVILKLVFPLLYLIFILINTLKVFIMIISSKSKEIPAGCYFLATDNFSPSLNEKILKIAKQAVWILNVNVSAKNYKISNNFYSVYELLSIQDLVKIFYNSMIVLFFVYRELGSYYILFTLNSFKWFLYKSATEKIPHNSTIYFIDHKDRWALLEDKLKVRNKILIQHGTEIINNFFEGCFSIIKGSYCHNLPYKFKTLTKVFTFSELEFKALCLSILSNVPEKEIRGYDFRTDEIPHDKFAVLIIGHHYIYGNFEKLLIERLQIYDIYLYVKNHPTDKPAFYFKLQQTNKFIIVNNNSFPNVDLVISYESTLAFEYNSIGKEVVYHTKNNIEEIINRINILLSERGRFQ